MKTDKVKRIQEIVNAFNPQIGGAAVKELENELEILVAPMPDILCEFQHHEEDSAREAIAVVAGRLFEKNTDEAGLISLLEALSKDQNKWVRIKAQRALTGGKADAEKMSPLGNACISLWYAKQKNAPNAELRSIADGVESAFRRKVMKRNHKKRGPIGEDMEATLLFFAMAYGSASKEEWTHDIDDQPGWKGDELRLLSLRRIAPMIASFAVWPRRGTRAFLVSVYEHDDYDDFACWTKDHNSPKEALNSINQLEFGIDARYFKDPTWSKVIYWV